MPETPFPKNGWAWFEKNVAPSLVNKDLLVSQEAFRRKILEMTAGKDPQILELLRHGRLTATEVCAEAEFNRRMAAMRKRLWMARCN